MRARPLNRGQAEDHQVTLEWPGGAVAPRPRGRCARGDSGWAAMAGDAFA
jgi:hypothetical protein